MEAMFGVGTEWEDYMEDETEQTKSRDKKRKEREERDEQRRRTSLGANFESKGKQQLELWKPTTVEGKIREEDYRGECGRNRKRASSSRCVTTEAKQSAK